MPLKVILFFGLFLFCAAGALVLPQLGIYGYIANYCIGAAGQWWAKPLSGLGIRYSFILALATIIGIFFNRQKLYFGEHLLKGQEILMVIFLVVAFFSDILTPSLTGSHYILYDPPVIKLFKMFVFVFLMTHVITDIKKFDGLLWLFVLVGLFLGLKAWDAPGSYFVKGRLEGIGGVDFGEANYFSAFMASILPIIGIQFLRSRWFGKLICFFSATFTVNAIILCRSRGAFLGLAIGALFSILFFPRRFRKQLVVCLILGIIGGIYLTDKQFIKRITTISTSIENLDQSSQSRIELWKAGLQMVNDHPFGIGIGNWYGMIGYYIPEYEGKDAHSTYVKCLAELGWVGLFVYCLILGSAFKSLIVLHRKHKDLETRDGFDLLIFSSIGTLFILLTCCLTMTLIYAEFVWLLLSIPICLSRIFENTYSDNLTYTSETND